MARALLLALAFACLTVPVAHADTIAFRSGELHEEDGELMLSAEFGVAINPTLEEALNRYGLTEEEFESWRWAFDRHGMAGLRTTLRGERA